MRAVLTALSLLAVSSLCAPPCPATVWHVEPDGSGDAPTIQAAVDLAVSGDVVELAGGIYLGTGNRDVQVLGKEILIRSASDDPLTCTVDVQGSPTDPHRAFVLQTATPPGAGLRGITITGGYDADVGGAVSCPEAGISYFEKVHFVANDALSGGALWIDDGEARFEDCEFVENRAVETDPPGIIKWGGAVYSDRAAATFARCRFLRNEAGTAGGAIYSYLQAITLTDCDFEDNVSVSGGAVLASLATIADCRFLRNQATNGGGGAVSGGTDFDRCSFVENVAGGGGAIWMGRRPGNIRDCEFLRNEAAHGGAFGAEGVGFQPITILRCLFEENSTRPGLANGGAAIAVRQDIVLGIVASTFVRNVSLDRGGAVYAWHRGAVAMEGCTLVGNSAPLGSGIYFGIEATGSSVRSTIIAFGLAGPAMTDAGVANPTIGCCDLYGNAGGDALVGIDEGGNFHADPLFCDAENDDFTIHSDSPCAPPGVTGCGLVGALPVGCGPIGLESWSWGQIKGAYR
jgi:predicted outer membrane repeat protein